MKSLVVFAILLTSYLTAARIEVFDFRLANEKFDFRSLKNVFQEARADVNKNLQEIIDLIPKEEIKNIVDKYIASDAEVKKDWEWLTSDDFKQLLSAIENSQHFKEIRQLLEKANVNVPLFVNQIHDIFGMGHISRDSPSSDGTGLRGMLDEIKPTIPMDKIKLKIGTLVVFSAAFRKLVKVLESADFKNAVAALQVSSEVTNITNGAEQNGVDLQAIKDFMNGLALFINDFDLN